MGGFRRIVRLTAVAAVLTLAATGAGVPRRVQSTPVAYTISTWFKSHYPYQYAARQYSTDARSKRWAFLIGLNNYAYPTSDLIGSRGDAETLRATLLNLGWRSDHIVLMEDGYGTASHMIDGIRWLASKATTASTVVFHYSGHENYTRTLADGDNETRDVELWGTDNRYILDGILGREMNRIAAYHMWIDISTCRASGFSDYGMIKAGRILTYSSTVGEFSYEDPRLKHSVFGYYELVVGLYQKHADANGDKKVSVEEAFGYARSPTTAATGGKQHPWVVDKVTGSMFLTIP